MIFMIMVVVVNISALNDTTVLAKRLVMGLAWIEYDRTEGFSSSAGAELFKTHVRLTEAEAELLQLKFD